MEYGVFEMIAIALLIIVMQNNDDNDDKCSILINLRFGASGLFFLFIFFFYLFIFFIHFSNMNYYIDDILFDPYLSICILHVI